MLFSKERVQNIIEEYYDVENLKIEM